MCQTRFRIGVAKEQHYRVLNTNLENLYESIKQTLKDEKDLQIVSEYKGTLARQYSCYEQVSQSIRRLFESYFYLNHG